MTLSEMLCALSPGKWLEIQTALIDAGITCEFNGKHKPIFRRLQKAATGKQKKIYAALSKADRPAMKRMSDLIITYRHLLP